MNSDRRPGAVAHEWSLSVREVAKPERGTNNLVWYLDGEHVLRVCLNRSEAEVTAENRLLEALRSTDLPFEVPRPIPTPDGRTHVMTSDGPATLYHLLPGRHARREPGELHLIGTALGDLLTALAQLRADLARRTGGSPWGPFTQRCPTSRAW